MKTINSDELKAALNNLPDKVFDSILKEYGELESRFSRGDWSPAELNGARYSEVIYRYLEWKHSGNFTPIGKSLDRQKIYNKISNDGSIPDGLRFQMLKSTEIMYDIRNKRDVAHLGDIIDVDEMDAKLIMRLAAWILAEIIREESDLSPKQAQDMIDRISAETYPLVEEIDGDLVILASNLQAKERSLVALYHKYPNPIESETLREAAEYSNKSRFYNSVVMDLKKESLIHPKNGQIYLTRKGIGWIEKNINMTLELR